MGMPTRLAAIALHYRINLIASIINTQLNIAKIEQEYHKPTVNRY